MTFLNNQIRTLRQTFADLGNFLLKADGVADLEKVKHALEACQVWDSLLLYSEPWLLEGVGVDALLNPEEEKDLTHLAQTIKSDLLDPSSEVDARSLPWALEEWALAVIQHLRKTLRRASKPETPTLHKYHTEIDNLDDNLARLASRIENVRLIDRTRETLREIEGSAVIAAEARDSARTAAGDTADSVLSLSYTNFGDGEAASAKWFRIATVVTIGAGVISAAFLPHSEEWSIGESVYRIAIVAGIFGLAGYLARQANHHRTLAVWAGSISIQLQTFEAFLAPTESPEIRDQMRSAFAQRVFGSTPTAKGEASVGPSTELLDSAASAVFKSASAK